VLSFQIFDEWGFPFFAKEIFYFMRGCLAKGSRKQRKKRKKASKKETNWNACDKRVYDVVCSPRNANLHQVGIFEQGRIYHHRFHRDFRNYELLVPTYHQDCYLIFIIIYAIGEFEYVSEFSSLNQGRGFYD
jgi:hypothetical protein